ncbi:hypothetical protein GUITHDRAFT_44272, partial [Guillardia theta CCMP2712]
EVGAPALSAAMNGMSSWIIAYGMIGSGKTFSITGTPLDPGICTRLFNDVFERSRSRSCLQCDVTVSVSYFEIHNDKARDLVKGFTPFSSDGREKLTASRTNHELVKGLSEHDMMKFKEAGDSIRKKSFHRLNPRSSRSHTVFSIHFEVAKRGASGRQDRGPACGEVSQGSLHLVDLAGFEDFSESSFGDMEEEQLLETAAINKSIGALRIVLNKLASRQRCHVPYESCLLTKVLQ